MRPFSPLPVLVVGESRSPEFQAGLTTLREFATTSDVPDLDAAQRLLSQGECCPDLVVLLQDRSTRG